jgi:hypothetical protein
MRGRVELGVMPISPRSECSQDTLAAFMFSVSRIARPIDHKGPIWGIGNKQGFY